MITGSGILPTFASGTFAPNTLLGSQATNVTFDAASIFSMQADTLATGLFMRENTFSQAALFAGESPLASPRRTTRSLMATGEGTITGGTMTRTFDEVKVRSVIASVISGVASLGLKLDPLNFGMDEHWRIDLHSLNIASMIDHTLLAAIASKEDLKKVCAEARQYKFATVCVNSANIPLVARELEGSGVKPISVVGFPLGAMDSDSKAFEAATAIKNGALEIDMVINIGALKSRDLQAAYEDILAVVHACGDVPVKVIIEASALTDDEKIAACMLAKAAGAAFVKTSTGFGSGGAKVEDVALMRYIVGNEMGVKASGGIGSREDVEKMILAGATRIGASKGIAIVTGKAAEKTGY